MIDIHTHILPNVDDGSTDIKDSLRMVFDAEQQGITDIVLTPHYRVDYRTKAEEIKSNFDEFKAKAQEAGVKANLYLGQEIYAFRDLEQYLENGKVIPINGGKYVLLEFATSSHSDIEEAAYAVTVKGYIPIIAHIERYPYADLDTAREVRNMGGLIQINAGSFCGESKRAFKKKSIAYLKEDLVDFVASDIHSFRKNVMETAYKLIEKKFGKERAEKLFYLNALPVIGK